jgi:predicted nucleic acid-binding protein
MDLVIDANIIMSALIAIEGKTCNLIFNDNLKLFSPEYLLEEFEEHKEEILFKSKLSNKEFEMFLLLISSRINFIPASEFVDFIFEAKKITPDLDYTVYFALAMKLNCAIWTNDKKLNEQKIIKIYSTKDLIELN